MNKCDDTIFDERLALLGLLLDAITGELKKVNLAEQALTELLNALKNVRMDLARPEADTIVAVQKQISNLEKKIQTGKLASTCLPTTNMPVAAPWQPWKR